MSDLKECTSDIFLYLSQSKIIVLKNYPALSAY